LSSRRFPISAKLLGSFAALVLLMVIIVAVALTRMSSMDQKSTAVGKSDLPSMAAIGNINGSESDYRAAQYRYVLSDTPQARATVSERLALTQNAVLKGFATYKTLIADAHDRALYNTAVAQWASYVKSGATSRRLSRDGRTAEAAASLTATLAPFNTLSANLQTWAGYNTKLANRDVEGTHNAYTSARTILLIVALLAVLISAGLALLISRSIKRAVATILGRLSSLREHDTTDLRTAMDRMAAGDLTAQVTPVTAPIEKWPNDELGDVAQAVNAVRDNTLASVEAYNASRESLAAMIGQVSGTAATVSSASQQMASTSDEAGRAVGEIANAVGEVAEGSQRQVMGIEDARRLTEEVAEATSRSAEDASQTAVAAEQARQIAAEGAEAVGQATEAMVSVRDASEQATAAIRALGMKSDEIGGIVSAITGIAEQTNLLALNAAIEAARAGEQGRGFAVVAEEVRKLAEESQTAAQSISALIGEIQDETGKAVEVVELGGQRTSDGAATVEQARSAFERIGGSVDDVTSRVGQIAASVQQIATSAQQMGERMADVAAVAEESSASAEEVSASTEQTSASTQEIAASAQELARSASDLEQLVSQFTLR
jgi:methyl-accepting chemotaxis protein